jgi:hypothetical protein
MRCRWVGEGAWCGVGARVGGARAASSARVAVASIGGAGAAGGSRWDSAQSAMHSSVRNETTAMVVTRPPAARGGGLARLAMLGARKCERLGAPGCSRRGGGRRPN